MKIHTLILVMAAVGLLVSIGVYVVLVSRYLPGYWPGMTFLEMGVVQKMLVSLAILITVGAVAIGLAGLSGTTRDPHRPGTLEIMLWLAGGTTVMFGGLAGAYGELVTQMVLQQVGPIAFEVTAPGRAQGVLALGIGLSGSVIALAFQNLLARRRAKALAEATGFKLEI